MVIGFFFKTTKQTNKQNLFTYFKNINNDESVKCHIIHWVLFLSEIIQRRPIHIIIQIYNYVYLKNTIIFYKHMYLNH